MTGILLKDIYNIRKQILWYLAITAVFFVLSVALKNLAFVSSMILFVTLSVPMTAVAYEERENWQKFLVASGTDVRIIVLEKYLLGAIFYAFGAIIYLMAVLLSGDGAFSWNEYVIPIAMSVVAMSGMLPLIFKFGVEKGRVMIVVIVVVTVLIWVGLLTLIDKMTAVSVPIVVTLSVAIAIAALLVSYFVSVHIYKRKEF